MCLSLNHFFQMDPQTWKPRAEGEYAQCLIHTAKKPSAGTAHWVNVLVSCSFPLLQSTPYMEHQASPSFRQPHTRSTRLSSENVYMAGTRTWRGTRMPPLPDTWHTRKGSNQGRGHLWHLHIVQKAKTNHSKEEGKPDTRHTAQVNLDNIILSEVTWSNKDKHWVIPLIRGT